MSDKQQRREFLAKGLTVGVTLIMVDVGLPMCLRTALAMDKPQETSPGCGKQKDIEDLAYCGFDCEKECYVYKATQENDLKVKVVSKLHEKRPHIVDMVKSGQIHLIINTPRGKITKKDETIIRSTAILYNVPLVTTIAGAQATVNAIEALSKKSLKVKSLQEYHKK